MDEIVNAVACAPKRSLGLGPRPVKNRMRTVINKPLTESTIPPSENVPARDAVTGSSIFLAVDLASCGFSTGLVM